MVPRLSGHVPQIQLYPRGLFLEAIVSLQLCTLITEPYLLSCEHADHDHQSFIIDFIFIPPVFIHLPVYSDNNEMCILVQEMGMNFTNSPACVRCMTSAGLSTGNFI